MNADSSRRCTSRLTCAREEILRQIAITLQCWQWCSWLAGNREQLQHSRRQMTTYFKDVSCQLLTSLESGQTYLHTVEHHNMLVHWTMTPFAGRTSTLQLHCQELISDTALFNLHYSWTVHRWVKSLPMWEHTLKSVYTLSIWPSVWRKQVLNHRLQPSQKVAQLDAILNISVYMSTLSLNQRSCGQWFPDHICFNA